MDTLVQIAVDVITPVFVMVGVSVAVDRWLSPDPRALSKLVVYLFTPALVFESLATTEIAGDEVAQLIGSALILSVLVALAAWGIARLARFDQKLTSAFVLTAGMINAGNFGVPINELAFGPEGRERAVIFFTGTVFISYTLGVFLASRGTVSTREALLNVFRVPLPYAAVLGLLLNLANIRLDSPFKQPVGWLADAAIPAMLVVLGLQLSRASFKGRIRPILMSAGVRLLVSPLIAAVLVIAWGLPLLTKQVAITQAAMPTAVISGVLAVEFGSDSEFVIGTILTSTLLSFVTLAIILALVI